MSENSRILTARESVPRNFEKHLNTYSASALMAGVGLLALAKTAEGEVVVSHVDIPICGSTVDLNNDKLPDFAFVCYASDYHFTFYRRLLMAPLTGGKAVGGARGSGGPYASALSSGAKIGPSAHFSSSVAVEQLLVERSGGAQSTNSYSKYSLVGQWANKGSRYLGIKFLIKGQTHYGWIRMIVTRQTNLLGGLNGTIYEYAYETVANKPIEAGATTDDSAEMGKPQEQPENSNKASFGILALGAEGIPLWRQ